MVELYSREQWNSIFAQPYIIIEDNGQIYNREDYYKLSRLPIGEIDTRTGLIYGTDYASISRQPIGKMVRDGDVIKVYDGDYYKSFAQPLYYFRDGYIYSGNDFYRGNPSGYYKGDLGIGSSSPDSSPSASAPGPDSTVSSSDEADMAGLGCLWFVFNWWKPLLLIAGVVGIPIIAIMSVREAYFVYNEYYDYLAVQLISGLIGSLYFWFKVKKGDKAYTLGSFLGDIPGSVFKFSTVLFGIYIFARVVIDAGLRWWLPFMAILCGLVSALFSLVSMFVVSIPLGLILYQFLPPDKKARAVKGSGKKKQKKKQNEV